MTMRITPSILSADFVNLQRDIERVSSCDAIHVDVMDNHFVPNLTIGVPVVEAIHGCTDLPLDVHLMIEDPDRWAPSYVEAGATTVSFHGEAARAPIRLARELRRLGARAGLVLKPATPIEGWADVLEEFDNVLLMTVEPGFGGQKFIESVLPKVTRTRELINAIGKHITIQLDGGITVDTIERCARAGADTFVAGSAVYGADDPDAMVRRLRELATNAVA